MIYILVGRDKERERAQQELFMSFKGSSFTWIDDASMTDGVLNTLTRGSGLFEEKRVFVLTGLLSDVVWESKIYEIKDALAASDTIFIFIEGSLTQALIKKYSKSARYIFESKEGVIDPKEKDNPFTFTDLFSNRDKKGSWLFLQKIRTEGSDPYQTIGMLFWATKNLILTLSNETAESLNMKPFVYTKTKRAATQWKKEELCKLSFDLIKVFHNSRFNSENAWNAIEKIVLTRL